MDRLTIARHLARFHSIKIFHRKPGEEIKGYLLTEGLMNENEINGEFLYFSEKKKKWICFDIESFESYPAARNAVREHIKKQPKTFAKSHLNYNKLNNIKESEL